MTSPQPTQLQLRTRVIWGAVAVAIIAAPLCLVLALPRLLEIGFAWSLDGRVPGGGSIRVEGLSLSELQITHLRVGEKDALQIDEIVVRYAVGQLVNGVVEDVAIRGLRLTAGDAAEREALFAALLGNTAEADAPGASRIIDQRGLAAVRVAHVSLEDARVHLETPTGALDAEISSELAWLSTTDADWSGEIRIESPGKTERATWRAHATSKKIAALVELDARAGRLRFELDAGHSAKPSDTQTQMLPGPDITDFGDLSEWSGKAALEFELRDASLLTELLPEGAVNPISGVAAVKPIGAASAPSPAGAPSPRNPAGATSPTGATNAPNPTSAPSAPNPIGADLASLTATGRIVASLEEGFAIVSLPVPIEVRLAQLPLAARDALAVIPALRDRARGAVRVELSATNDTGQLATLELPGSLSTVPGISQGDFALRATAEAGAISLAIDVAGDIEATTDRIRGVLSRCAVVELRGIELGPLAGLSELSTPDLRLCSPSDGAPSVEIALEEDAGLRLTTWGVRLPEFELKGAFARKAEASGDPMAFTGRMPAIEISGDWLQSDPALRIVTSGGVETLSEPACVASGLQSHTELRLADAGVALSSELHLAEIRSLAQPPLFKGLALDARLAQRPDALELEARIHDTSEVFAFEVEATAHPSLESGQVEFALASIQFEVDGLQPEDLYPRYPGELTEAAGNISFSGAARWDSKALVSSADLTLEDLSFLATGFPVTGIAGHLHFDSLSPLSLLPNHRVTIDTINVGIALTDGVIDFRLQRDGLALFDAIDFETIGGQIRGSGQVDATREADAPDARPSQLLFQLLDLDLGELLEQLEIDGLSGTGTFTGALPILMDERGLVVLGGSLGSTTPSSDGASAEPGGWIRYRPPVPASALTGGRDATGVEQTFALLENFRYQTLRIGIDGELSGAIELSIHLAGSNPDYLNGYPAALNFNLSLPLLDLLRSVENPIASSEAIQQRFLERQQDDSALD